MIVMSKLIIFGASGFVGQALLSLLKKNGVDHVAHSSKTLDLTSPDSVQKIAENTKSGDTIIMLSALTPEKGSAGDTTVQNILMTKHLLDGIKNIDIGHFIYISSDAVYPLTADIVDEQTPPLPYSLYGHMHLMREQFVKEYFKPEKLTIFRPCAIYGNGDTHNAYGIMRFIRSAAQTGEISLFGGGEEYRDHIHVDDLATIIFDSYRRKISGIFNVASGKSWRFSQVAEFIQSNIGKKTTITCKPRAMPIFHRHVDISKLRSTFPNHKLVSIEDGIHKLLKEIF